MNVLNSECFASVGQQTRSRVILTFPGPGKESCPLNLIETRRCSSANCPRYTWQTGNWMENKRLVWCQDETGGKVLGKAKQTLGNHRFSPSFLQARRQNNFVHKLEPVKSHTNYVIARASCPSPRRKSLVIEVWRKVC